MLTGRLCMEDQVSAEDALGRAYALWDAVSASEPIALYGAVLSGDSLLLGAYQHAAQALGARAREQATLLRRLSGGPTLRAGDGLLYAAVCLHVRSTLMACPPQRILNRNVRGALAGLRKLGVAAHYFGRDYISIEARPAVFAGWDAQPDGRVMLELLLAERTSYLPEASDIAYPPREQDGFRGKTLITLQEAGARAQGREVLASLAKGYGEMANASWREAATSDDERRRARDKAPQLRSVDHGQELAWSLPREEAIGFVSAGVALDSSGKLAAVELAGDFFQDHGCAAALQRMLLGVEPSSDTIARALDTVYARSGHELEGVRTLETFRESILDAVARARART